MNTPLIQSIEKINQGNNFNLEGEIICQIISLAKSKEYDAEEKLNIFQIALEKINKVKESGFVFIYLTLSELNDSLNINSDKYENIIQELENCHF